MHDNGKTKAKHLARAQKREERRRRRPKTHPFTALCWTLAQDRRFATVREIEESEGREAGEIAAMCTTKMAFDTKEEALAEIDRRVFVPGHKSMKAYRCPVCGKFHITHRKRSLSNEV